MAETKTGRKGATRKTLEQKRDGAPAAHDATTEKGKGNKKTDDQADDQEMKPKKPFKWTPLKVIVLVVIALILIILGTLYYIYSSHHATTDDAFTTGHIHNISSRVAGTVIAVLVDDNEFVKQGQVLVKLDPRDYQVKVDQARADYLNAKANDERILLVKGNGAISQQDYDQSQATLLIDKAKLDDASNQLNYCTICAPTDGYVGAKAV